MAQLPPGTANDNESSSANIGELDPELALLLDEQPSLRALPAVIRLVHDRPWFANIGAPATGDNIAAVRAYVAALGFAHVEPAFLETPEEAQDAALAIDINDAAWEAEEQLRESLTQNLIHLLGEEVTTMVFSHLSSETATVIAEAVRLAAVRAGIEDEDFMDAALGAGMQACHQAALVALTGEPDHPFSLRFRLFEQGRWPLIVAGNSFLIY